MSELKPCPIRHKTYEIKQNFKDRSLEETQAVASELFTDLLTALDQRDKLRSDLTSAAGSAKYALSILTSGGYDDKDMSNIIKSLTQIAKLGDN